MRWWRRGLEAALALGIGAAFAFPLYFTAVTSLDSRAQVFQFPPALLPAFHWQVYARAWAMADWPRYLANSLLIAAATILLALATSILAAYALAYLPFRGKPVLFAGFLAVLMIPGEAVLIPNFLTLHALGLLNTLTAQVLPYGGSVYGIFLLRQYFLTVPREYWDAARVEGAGHGRYLWAVLLPMARPILVTIVLYIFIGVWNSLLWPLIVTSSHRVQPVEVAVARLVTGHSVDWRRLSAAALFTTAPVVVLFLAFQRYILRGIGRGEGIQG